MIGYLGANGAGKTTSLKIALGFSRPTSGKVSFSPKLGATPREAMARIGFLPERPYFYPHLTGHEFSDYMGLLSGMRTSEIGPRREKLAERLGIAAALGRPLRTYSKGMLQRMGFLVAIQHDPQIIILDEPLSGLDPLGRKELKDLMGDIHKEGKTVFFSTHIVSDVEETCDSMVFLRQGKVVYSGSVKALLDQNPARLFRVVIESSNEPIFQTPVVSKSRQNAFWLLKVETGLREKLVMEALGSGCKLISVGPEGARLEDIFYGAGQ